MSSSGQTADGRTGAGNGRIKGEEKKAQRRTIPERKKPATKTNFSGDRLCFNFWLCRSFNFAALRLMTRLFQPNGLSDQISGKKEEAGDQVLRPCCLATGSFSGEQMFRRSYDLFEYRTRCGWIKVLGGHSSKKPGHLWMAATSPRANLLQQPIGAATLARRGRSSGPRGP